MNWGLSTSETFTWTTTYPTTSAMILNEWNAVASDEFLKDGGSDSFFGTVLGNGGDWFELVVTEDNLDIRGWTLELLDTDNEQLILETTDVFEFADDPLLANVRSGTIITVSEDRADDASYDPASDDWWIALQSNSDDAGAYFTPSTQSNFDTNNDNWQLIIRDAAGNPVFGPAGEGAGASGVSSTEVGELEQDPSNTITPASLYDDGSSSTYGAPNGFDGGFQDFDSLRPVLADTEEPDTTAISPAKKEVLEDTAVVLTGEATDNVGVTAVGVAIRNRDTNQWLRIDGSYGNTQYHPAILDNPGSPLTGWSLPIELTEGRWAIRLRSDDAAGNRESTRLWVPFEVGTPVTDLEKPDTSVSDPERKETVGGPTVALSGEATDDVGVARVRVSVQDRISKDYLQSDGSFGSSNHRFEAVLADPDQPLTIWTLSVDLPPGSYAAIAQAIDVVGKRDSSRAWSPFFVGTADNAEPDSTLDTVDTSGSTLTLGGTATDNVGVTRVAVSIKNKDTDQWLQDDGSLASGFNLITTTLSAPSATATDWSFSTTLPAGNYAVFVRGYDAVGNVESTRPSAQFTIDGGLPGLAAVDQARADEAPRGLAGAAAGGFTVESLVVAQADPPDIEEPDTTVASPVKKEVLDGLAATFLGYRY